MSANEHRPAKRQKKNEQSVSSNQQARFKTAQEIHNALTNPSPDMLKTGLTTLRNQFTIQAREGVISSDDQRFLLAKEWLDQSNGANELFSVWSNSSNPTVISLSIAVLASVLNLLSQHFIYHPYGDPIISQLLTPLCMRRLNSYLGGGQTETILTALKLLNAMAEYADGRERRAIMDNFAWNMKSLPKLFNMRRRGTSSTNADSFAKPDIRTLYITFILSFLTPNTPVPLKQALLEDHKDTFTSMFKGMIQDPYDVVRRILEVCWEGVWGDVRIRRTTKVRLFNENVLGQLAKLYTRNQPEASDSADVPADLVHHFLLAICSRRGSCLCFKDRGWYPAQGGGDDGDDNLRPIQDDDVESSIKPSTGARVHNRLLGNFLKILKVSEDSRQQELALKILEACPELVQGYWPSAGITLEPRLSSRWITNVAYFGAVVSLPIPQQCFLLAPTSHTNNALYNPTPPPLAAILANVIPGPFSKSHVTKGLQRASAGGPLVQHLTALALSKSLEKYEAVLRLFRKIENALGEENEDVGMWGRRRKELEREIRKRVPDFQTIVALSQKVGGLIPDVGKSQLQSSPVDALMQSEESPSQHPSGDSGASMRSALLSEIAMRLMWQYHRSLPALAAEARFDTGKLLLSLGDVVELEGVETNGNTSLEPARGIDVLAYVHVLRLLQVSDQFSWHSKIASTSHTYLHRLLHLYAHTQISSIQTATANLIHSLLSRNVLYEHDPLEVSQWLSSIPLTCRSPTSSVPDLSNGLSISLTDERDGLIAFLDECIQRCLKTPYRYLESTFTLLYPNATLDQAHPGGPELAPSPLLMVVLEQFAAKAASSSLLSPSDALGITTFLRKLMLGLVAKYDDDLVLLGYIVSRVNEVLADVATKGVFPKVISDGIERERRLLYEGFSRLQPGASYDYNTSAPSRKEQNRAAVEDFLLAVEQAKPTGKQAFWNAAELVDWVRLVDEPLIATDILRIARVFIKWKVPSSLIRDYFYHLPPPKEESTDARISTLISAEDVIQPLISALPFPLALAQCTIAEMSDPSIRSFLLDILFDHTDPSQIPRMTTMIVHRTSSRPSSFNPLDGLFDLLTSVLLRVHNAGLDDTPLKKSLFDGNARVREILQSQDGPYLRSLIGTALNPTSESDIALASGYCSVWATRVINKTSNAHGALSWIPYMDANTLIQCLDAHLSQPDLGILEEVCKALQSRIINTTVEALHERLSRLIRLSQDHEIVTVAPALPSLLSFIVEAAIPVGFDMRHPSVEVNSLLRDLCNSAEQRLLNNRSQDPKAPFTLTVPDIWTLPSARMTSTLIYHSRANTIHFAEWLSDSQHLATASVHVVYPLHAFLDVCLIDDLNADTEEIATIHKGIAAAPVFLPYLMDRILDLRETRDAIRAATSALVTLFVLLPAQRADMTKLMSEKLEESSSRALFSESFQTLILQVARLGQEKTIVAMVDAYVDRGLQWLVRRFAEDEKDSQRLLDALPIFTQICQIASPLKPQLAEPVLVAAVQNRLRVIQVVEFLSVTSQRTNFKPVVSNRLLQSIIQHPLFVSPEIHTSSPSASRPALISLLHTLFFMHPANACQPSHVMPLVKVYRGTLDVPDRRLLSIFALFEQHRSLSVLAILQQWRTTPVTLPAAKPLDTLTSLDAALVFKSCSLFPSHKILQDANEPVDSSVSGAYDPRFVLGLLAATVADPMLSGMDWVMMFRTNAASLAVRCLSSKLPHIRSMAVRIIAGLWTALQIPSFQESAQTLYVLNLVRDMLSDNDTQVPRLPTYSTLLLAHALRVIYYPAHFMYPLISRFLLQRPELDRGDVPLLFSLLYSSTDDWRKERAWEVRFLADGMRSSSDWRVLQRRHTWDLLASLFQSSDSDGLLRTAILDVLVALTANAQAAASLVLRLSLLPWIGLQTTVLQKEEVDRWLHIIENLSIALNHDKTDQATLGSWRKSIYGSLSPIIAVKGPVSRLQQALRILSRLTLVTNDTMFLVDILPLIHNWIVSLEQDIKVGDKEFESWGKCVEMAWEIAMASNDASSVWTALTSRLLVWHTYSGTSRVGEWARRQVISNIRE